MTADIELTHDELLRHLQLIAEHAVPRFDLPEDIGVKLIEELARAITSLG